MSSTNPLPALTPQRSVLTIHARPTIYAGIQMRSRLEASFAQWLDTDPTQQWSYEGRCYASSDGQYLPDFYVYFGWRDDWEYCEVKPPVADFAAVIHQMHIILASEPQARLGVWTTSKDKDLGFFRADWCLPDIGCGHCDRPKLLAGYER